MNHVLSATLLSGLAALASMTVAGKADANIPKPSNFHEYCSYLGSGGTTLFKFSRSGSDPCGSALDPSIRAAGYYDTVGYNVPVHGFGSSDGPKVPVDAA